MNRRSFLGTLLGAAVGAVARWSPLCEPPIAVRHELGLDIDTSARDLAILRGAPEASNTWCAVETSPGRPATSGYTRMARRNG